MLGKSVQRRWWLGIAVIGVSILSGNRALAQITPDATLPNNSIVTPNGTTFNITGGTPAGANLFHSFREFSVPASGEAFFNNAVNIQNIISRVTGGSISNVDGSIRALGSANVFLINPNGIVFGSNASLNIGGSFVATTANAIQFGNLGTFSATVPNNPALLTVNPSALFYNQIVRSASIQNSSIAPAGINPNGVNTTGLRVADGNSLLLVGGNVNLDSGNLRAYGGHIELAGLAAPGSVGLNIAGNTLSLSVPNDVQRADVSLANQAVISVVGNGGGDIAINARNLEISNSYLFGGIVGTGLSNANTVAGDIKLNATGAITLDQGSQVSNEVDTQGNGGNIKIDTGSLTVQNGSQLLNPVFGQGNGGNIIINAGDRVNFDGRNSDNFSSAITSVQPGAVGKAGDILLTTGTLSLTNGAFLSSGVLGKGNGGNITINADNAVTFDRSSYAKSIVSQGAVGNGGNIKVTTGSLSLTNGSRLDTNVLGQGNAGNITIDARDSVNLDGVVGSPIGGVQSDLLPGGVGKGGNIQITTGSLSVTNGAEVTTETGGRGNAGNITINARDTVTFNGVSDDGSQLHSLGGSRVASHGVGNAGDIRVTAGALFLTDGGQLDAASDGQGNAGNITINARDAITVDATGKNTDGFPTAIATYLSSGGAGNKGGDIQLTTGSLTVSNGSIIFSVSTSEQGNAGNINLTTGSFSLTNGSQLASSTSGQGNAGNINLTTGSLSLTNGSKLVSSTSGGGNGGNITIDARDTVRFDGVGNNQNPTGAYSTVESGGMGSAGSINVTTGSLSLNNSSQISATTVGQGNAGDISVNARDTITLNGRGSNGRSSGVFSQVDPGGVGRGGNLSLTTGLLSLTNGAQLSAGTFGQGNAGDLTINARDTLQLNNGTISTQANSFGGGNVTIAVKDIQLRNNSLIRTDLSSGQGSGGNIALSADTILALEDSDILAFASQGRGGNISFDTRAFLSDPLYSPTPLTTSSVNFADFRNNGRVDVNASGAISGGNITGVTDTSFIQNSLTELPQNLINPNTLIANSCIARSTKQQGTFTITGSGGLPNRPGDVSVSVYPTGDVRNVSIDAGSHAWRKGDPIVEPQGVYQLPAGHLVLSRECL